MDTSSKIAPQEGPQTDFLSTEADIAIFGGSAGGGKSYAMLIDPLRHINSCPDAGAVYFRKTSTQITAEGGLFDEAKKLYSPLGAKFRESPHTDVMFPGGFKISFRHLQHEKNKYDHQGGQYPIIYFDELTHFSRSQFFYLVGRNRSTCGINPYVRSTCNPDKTSWVRNFIDWWIDDDGYAIPERSGAVRYLCVVDDHDHWFNSITESLAAFPDIHPISVTFILSRLKDNPALLEKDPMYRSKLMSLPKVERERLLGDDEKGGNWDIVPAAGMYFKAHYFEEIMHPPPFKRIIRCWDRAATEWNAGDTHDPDYTVGLKMGETYDGQFVILDIERERYSAGKVERLIKNVAIHDGQSVEVKGFQDPGSAGKSEAENFVKMLSGFVVSVEKITKDKETQAKPLSSQAEHGNIKIMANCKHKEAFYSEMENFPDDSHDDIVDAASGAFNELNSGNVGQFTKAFNQNTISVKVQRDKW